MRACRPRLAAFAFAAAALVFPAPAASVGKPSIAALQVGLHARGLYAGPIDGMRGPGTTAAVRKLQRRAGLPVDGVVGRKTRAALGRYAKHGLGSRPLRAGTSGWDVAGLQFLLAWHGFPSGSFDGQFAGRTDRALRRFQRWAGLTPDGIAGPGVVAALRGPRPHVPISLAWPVHGPIGSPFGPRGSRFHSGIDIVAPSGTPVRSAAAGTVAFAGWAPGGWGNLVIVDHSSGTRSMYAHLSVVSAKVGRLVVAGSRLGLVGATGDATGAHLHFEVRLRGASVDPLPALD
jgi:murein DD-endopeptidase MepM/ murein hydrolase activator NlpD